MSGEMICADCGFPMKAITKATLNRGSSIREPGEALCPSCTSSRVRMVRELKQIPNSLADIRAKRRWAAA